MRIGELSERTGISTSRIRFYEKHDVLPKPTRNGNGYRTYPDTAVKILELIDAAQRLGFSLNEIRTGLSEAAPNLPSRAAMAKALRSKLDHIDQHIKDVRARRRQIVKLLEGNGRLSASSRAARAMTAACRPRARFTSRFPRRTDRSLTQTGRSPHGYVAELNIGRRRETP